MCCGFHFCAFDTSRWLYHCKNLKTITNNYPIQRSNTNDTSIFHRPMYTRALSQKKKRTADQTVLVATVSVGAMTNGGKRTNSVKISGSKAEAGITIAFLSKDKLIGASTKFYSKSPINTTNLKSFFAPRDQRSLLLIPIRSLTRQPNNLSMVYTTHQNCAIFWAMTFK